MQLSGDDWGQSVSHRLNFTLIYIRWCWGCRVWMVWYNLLMAQRQHTNNARFVISGTALIWLNVGKNNARCWQSKHASKACWLAPTHIMLFCHRSHIETGQWINTWVSENSIKQIQLCCAGLLWAASHRNCPHNSTFVCEDRIQQCECQCGKSSPRAHVDSL